MKETFDPVARGTMEFQHTAEELVNHIATAIRGEVRIDNENYIFTVDRVNREFFLAKSDLSALMGSVLASQLSDETGLYAADYFEMAVKEEGSVGPSIGRRTPIAMTDNESSISYEISLASDRYLLWFLAGMYSRGISRRMLPNVPWGLGDRWVDIEPDQRISVFEILRASIRLMTVKINSTSKLGLKRMQIALYAFLFQLAYNLDVALVPQRFFEKLFRRSRIRRMRRGSADELDPPRRTYKEELVTYYILAVSTDSPTVQFLSYYHILEHFFENVFNDDLMNKIRSAITDPSFSYKRRKDIEKLISTISKNVQLRCETVSFNEGNALLLTLQKFIDVADLHNKINAYDAGLLDYFSQFEVPFSNGKRVNLRADDYERILKELAHRIYATRNALVHSKDGDKPRYTPFKDERALMMEVPLIRFISEMIILHHSEAA